MPVMKDGPVSPHFAALPMRRTSALRELSDLDVSAAMQGAAAQAPSGNCVMWGLPFDIRRAAVLRDEPVTVNLPPAKRQWLAFLHTADFQPTATDKQGFVRPPMTGQGRLGELAARYVVRYADGAEESLPIRQRHEIGMYNRSWGECCFEAVMCHKPYPIPSDLEQVAYPDSGQRITSWGPSQFRVVSTHWTGWGCWIWAWKNPHPRKPIASIRFEPVSGTVVVLGLSTGRASETPYRWGTRKKAVLSLPRAETFRPALRPHGLLEQIQLDLGQVISARPQLLYPNDRWARTRNNLVPEVSGRAVLVEYTAHPDAMFHLAGGKRVAVADLERKTTAGRLRAVTPATQRVTVRVIDRKSRQPVAAKLHVHGAAGEYLAPLDRHRTANTGFFEDFSADWVHEGVHACTYIPGETRIDLPLGEVFLEVSKGFEIKPVRKVVHVTGRTRTVTVELARVLRWRERGWVCADTHIHCLQPTTGVLEGAAEGVNVVNLLATQLGEHFTNTGDFDGRTVHAFDEPGARGEYLLKVGTENRQRVLGHISLLGYKGGIITPITAGGPDESALGDPVDVLLTEWAAQCRKQKGVVIIPHFPNPRAEHAATIVLGLADGIEWCGHTDLYGGISPYSLSDYYRYLNCGYLVPIVGGTDKMGSSWAVGAMRTYAKLAKDQPFTYDRWLSAIRNKQTFCSYGPLMEFHVEGKPMGQCIRMPKTGGTVDVTWNVESCIVPMTRVELIRNGEIVAGRKVKAGKDKGSFRVTLDKSSWLALLVRGKYADKPEMIAAHGTPVMVQVGDSPVLAAADAMTILEQIEGAMAYVDTVGTRAETKRYKEMRLVLEAAHRSLHNRLHQQGRYHDHTPTRHHAGH